MFHRRFVEFSDRIVSLFCDLEHISNMGKPEAQNTTRETVGKTDGERSSRVIVAKLEAKKHDMPSKVEYFRPTLS
jgi:hypothetical protein